MEVREISMCFVCHNPSDMLVFISFEDFTAIFTSDNQVSW